MVTGVTVAVGGTVVVRRATGLARVGRATVPQAAAYTFLTNDQPCAPDGSSGAFTVMVNMWSAAPSTSRRSRNSLPKALLATVAPSVVTRTEFSPV
ncbi:hypothetical protein ABZX92_43815 [Lentzea sp. NPDC006480]|uniref:hypothetical protein n=1 Tax=Lentzea sp. NPDC006480 TaxID=3157176 RepID=UPI0033ACC988